MNIMQTAAKVLDVFKLARNLQGATSSRVTRTQGGATLLVCVVVAALSMIPGSPLADFAVAMAAVTVLVPTLSPLLSRMFGHRDKQPSTAELTVPEFLDDLAALLEAKEARQAEREVDAQNMAIHKTELVALYREARARMLAEREAKSGKGAADGSG
jgi:ABC-type transport system involved in cytochrome bd biosynthesis fused ATPase/permease subunit